MPSDLDRLKTLITKKATAALEADEPNAATLNAAMNWVKYLESGRDGDSPEEQLDQIVASMNRAKNTGGSLPPIEEDANDFAARD